MVDRGYVRIRFTGTRGGTEFDVTVDRVRSNLVSAEVENQSGRLTIGSTPHTRFRHSVMQLTSLAGQ